jgi:hypothetical protein
MKKIVLILLSIFNYLVACDTEYEACRVGCQVASSFTFGLSDRSCYSSCFQTLKRCRA